MNKQSFISRLISDLFLFNRNLIKDISKKFSIGNYKKDNDRKNTWENVKFISKIFFGI